MLRAARSSLITTIMAAMARSRMSGNHSLSGHFQQLFAEILGERFGGRLQIVARIEAGWNFADVLAQRLAIAQMHGAREHVHLPARVVDVVLARDIEAGERQQVGKRIAEHGAAAMADVHGAGRGWPRRTRRWCARGRRRWSAP